MDMTRNERTSHQALVALLLLTMHGATIGLTATTAAAESAPAAQHADGERSIARPVRVAQRGAAETGNRQDLVDDDQFADLSIQSPEIVGGRYQLPPLMVETIAMDEIGNGRTPESFRADQPVVQTPLPESASERVPSWNWSLAQWAAPNTFFYPLYFEDRMLERHGHLRFGCLQPAAAATRFVGSAIMLPYLATVDPPCDCEYSLGYYRSGSCAPPLLQRPPYERRAAIAEAVWMGGAIAIFP